ncbi:MAG: hypothetical protein J7513_16320 [Solirubrobacteraceae bacterium]|nr:hypothetical protein [Solirubrobacteraceae bacterium]
MIEQWTVESMYGLIIIADPDNKAAEIPETGRETVFTNSAVAVPVQPYVDGPVSLWLGPASEMTRKFVVFDGELECPTGRLGIELPEDDDIVAIDVPRPVMRVVISIDDLDFATSVWVGVDL